MKPEHRALLVEYIHYYYEPNSTPALYQMDVFEACYQLATVYKFSDDLYELAELVESCFPQKFNARHNEMQLYCRLRDPDLTPEERHHNFLRLRKLRALISK